MVRMLHSSKEALRHQSIIGIAAPDDRLAASFANKNLQLHLVPRPRRVLQSIHTVPFTVLWCILHCIRLLWFISSLRLV